MMATLRNSSLKLPSHNYINTLCKPQIRPLILPFKTINVRFSRSISLPHKTTHLLSPISSLSSQTDLENEGQGIEDIDESKTVRVKFQLNRECSFGEQFFIVGDDAMIGSWNPLHALQLNWSDGHIWTVELDVPIGRSIKFKFLLKENSEEGMLWQPGPDRILQTWETNKMICVCEDWDNADLQKLMEEELSCDKIDTSIMEKLNQPVGSQAFEIEVNGRAVNVEKDESYQGVGPVLVPGLTPLSIDDEQESNNEVQKNFDFGVSDTKTAEVDKAFDVPERQVDDAYVKETTEMMVVDKEEPNQDEEAENTQLAEEQEERIAVPLNNGVLENDIQWGLQTLQKLLSNFGIL